jgi:hypothetical protein
VDCWDFSVGIATRCEVDGPVGVRCSDPVHTDPEAHRASGRMGAGALSRGYSSRGVKLTPHLVLVLRPPFMPGQPLPLPIYSSTVYRFCAASSSTAVY